MDINEVLLALVKRMPAVLAFSAFMILLGSTLQNEIPSRYQPVPFLLGVAGLVLYGILAFFQIRQKNQPHSQGSVHAKKIENSAVATQNRGLLIQIVNNYAQFLPGVNKQAMEQQLIEYLNWVEETFSTITLYGIEQEGRQVVSLPLESIYVPLSAEYGPESFRDAEAHFLDLAESNNVTKNQDNLRGKIISLNQAMRLGSRLIITGGPGSGKSTVLQHIAWTLANSIKTGKSSLSIDKLGMGTVLPLPIYIPLSLYTNYLRNLDVKEKNDGRIKSLAYFISNYLLERQTNLTISPDFLAYLLRDEKHVLLLFDGMDEVPSDTERYQVRQAIEDLVSGRETLRVIVTSRTAAYQGQASLGRGFKQLRVQPLNSEQIKSLIKQAYKAIYINSSTLASTKADELLESIAQLEQVRHQRLGGGIDPLVTTPLMVRMILIVAFNNRVLPAQRADLFQKTIDAMLRPDYTLDIHVVTDIERRMGGSLAMNRDMLQCLAFNVHTRDETHKHDNQRKNISYGEALKNRFEEETLRLILNEEPAYRPFVQELITQTRQRNTLIEERNGSYRFTHLSFQEFLAGRYMAQNMDVETIAVFFELGNVLDKWWREPALLMVGYLDITAPALARRLIVRLARLSGDSTNNDLSDNKEIAAVELIASAFLECQNQSYDLRVQIKKRLEYLLVKKEAVFTDPIVRSNAADILDIFGYIPPDLYKYVSIPTSPSPSCNFGIYPVTNTQYERFLNVENFNNKALWVDFPKFDMDSRLILDGSREEDGWKWLQNEINNNNEIVENGVLYPRYWRDSGLGRLRANAPVVGISWWEANAYCRWLLLNWNDLENLPKPKIVRLPTESEWVSASGGNGIDRYAWDIDQPTTDVNLIAQKANTYECGVGHTTTVWMNHQGKSYPFGLKDMSGNIWEWQANYYDKDYSEISLRGGAWTDNQISARVSYRFNALPSSENVDIGFRIMFIGDEEG